MKRILSLLLVLAITLSMLTSCSIAENITGKDDTSEGENESQGYRYKSFTNAEKRAITELIGELIPFVPCDRYYFEGLKSKTDYSEGINFYTLGNTEEDFIAYVEMFEGYQLTDTYEDNYGDTRYTYKKGRIVVDLSYYYYDNANYIDVIIYPLAPEGDNNNTGDNANTGNNGNTGDSGNTGNNGNTGDSGNTGDNGNTGDSGNTGTTETGYRVLDFTKAKDVKDVTDQGYYLDGCPTTGSPKVLVIPVQFSDVPAEDGYHDLDKLEMAFNGSGDDTDYFSVDEYYKISSYGKLDLDITVLDEWFMPSQTSTYYKNAKSDDEYADDIGDQMILDEALAYLESKMDLSEFDSDGNSIIDAVVMVNTLDVGEDDFNWAYRYWNYYVDDQGYYYEYDGVSANDYIWMSYSFLYETEGQGDEVDYSDTSVMNTYTFIHEFAHVLGADDYYDTAYVSHPLGGYDMMDSSTADHSAFTKFNYGWITSSRLVNTTSSVTLTLEDFTESGDTIIIANSYSDDLGAYQEYYIVVYYTNNGLNAGDYGLFEEEGIIVYHINAELYTETYEGETYTDIKNNNTHSSDEYGSEDNLIELVKSSTGDYVYGAGDRLPTVTDDNGKTLGYTFTVVSIGENEATITFTKK